MMNIDCYNYTLAFKTPFRLAHGTRKGTDIVIVKITHLGISGFGEASMPPYMAEDQKTVVLCVRNLFDQLKESVLMAPLESDVPSDLKSPAASAAFEMAVLNWWCSYKKKTLKDLLAIPSQRVRTTLTFSKSDKGDLSSKLHLLNNFSHMKIKLTGDDDDIDFVKYIKRQSAKSYIVDINQGVKSIDKGLKLCEQLAELDCTLIEQPLHKDDIEGHQKLKQEIEVPIIADESIRSFEDLKQRGEAFDGVNLKLMKCGGLKPSFQMLNYVKANYAKNYVTLIGCMSESSLGVSFAGSIAPLFDYADLDGPYLIKNDPFSGFRIEKGEIKLNSLKSDF